MASLPNISDAEIARRLAIIRAAKKRLGRDLTETELDKLIEPVDCLRTRTRLAGKRGVPNAARA